MPTRDRGARVLCPIHRPEQPSDAASVTNDASRPPMRRCQGNEVFNTALATDMAACAFEAYHQPAGDRKVPPPLPPLPLSWLRLSVVLSIFSFGDSTQKLKVLMLAQFYDSEIEGNNMVSLYLIPLPICMHISKTSSSVIPFHSPTAHELT